MPFCRNATARNQWWLFQIGISAYCQLARNVGWVSRLISPSSSGQLVGLSAYTKFSNDTNSVSSHRCARTICLKYARITSFSIHPLSSIKHCSESCVNCWAFANDCKSALLSSSLFVLLSSSLLIISIASWVKCILSSVDSFSSPVIMSAAFWVDCWFASSSFSSWPIILAAFWVSDSWNIETESCWHWKQNFDNYSLNYHHCCCCRHYRFFVSSSIVMMNYC